MSINANTINVQGNLSGKGIYTNNLGSGSTAPLAIATDVNINGSVFSKGRIQYSDTMYLTMRPPQDLPLVTNEHFITGSDMLVDPQTSDASTLSQLTDILAIWNWNNGTFTIPVDGLYTIEIQGSFSNTVPDAVNGVYWYFRNHAHPNARVAANIQRGQVVSASTTRYFLQGDIIQPAFYSSDAGAVILANGESYLSSLIQTTLDVDHSKYYRLPTVV